jgi:TPR repeat protein
MITEETKRKALEGDPEAQWALGDAYEYGDIPPEPGKTSMECALEWLKKSADQGHKPGQFTYGSLLYYDQVPGIEHEEALKQALPLLIEASTSDTACGREAQYLIGRMYYYGNGVAQDKAKGMEWFEKAANQGQSESLFLLSMEDLMSAINEITSGDPQKAKGLYLKVCKNLTKALEIGFTNRKMPEEAQSALEMAKSHLLQNFGIGDAELDEYMRSGIV